MPEREERMANYLVDGAILKCSCGKKYSTLKIPEGGMEIDGQRIAGEEDKTEGVNFHEFGYCSALKEMCSPIIGGRWMCVNKKMALDNKKVISDESALLCLCGGVITPIDTGQSSLAKLLLKMKPEQRVALLGIMKGWSYGGDPVNLCTGNMVFEKEDLYIPGAFPLSLIRTYNSMDDFMEGDVPRTIGLHFRHNHEMYIKEQKEVIEVIYGNGRKEFFHKKQGRSLSKYGSRNLLQVDSEGGYKLKTEAKERFYFNKQGLLTKKEDQNGNEIEYLYENGMLTSVKNICGQIFFFYNDLKLLSSISDHTGRSVTYEYQENGMLSSVTDPLGYTSHYLYQENDCLCAVINRCGITVATNTLDHEGRVIKQIMADGGIISYEYEEENQRVIMTKQDGSKEKYYYDEEFREVRAAYRDGRDEKAYDRQGRLVCQKDKNQNIKRYEYDEKSGKLSKIINALGHEILMEYDHNGNLSKAIWEDGAVNAYRYDSNGNMIEYTDPLGRTTAIKRIKNGLSEEIKYSDASSLLYRYDSRFNIVWKKDRAGICCSYWYDDLNRIVRTDDAMGNQTHFTYDACNHLLELTNAEGNKQTFEYNEKGDLVRFTDFNDTTVSWEYNDIGKVSKMINQEGNETVYEYDYIGNVSKIINPLGAETEYLYDRLNHLESIIFPDGSKVAFQYDPNGNRTKITSKSGEEILYYYNEINKVIKIENSDGVISEFTYDKAGRVTAVTDARGNQNQMTYDAAGQKISETDVLGRTIYYTYTQSSEIETITDPVGRVTRYEYQPGDVLNAVYYPAGKKEQYYYDKCGRLKTKEIGKHYQLSYEYDSLGRMILRKDNYGHKTIYTYDAAGNMTALTNPLGNTTDYCYTPLGRLSGVVDAQGCESLYGYDVAGHLISISQREKDNPELENRRNLYFERDIMGRIQKITDAMGNSEYYQYDQAGNIVSKIDRDGYETLYSYENTGLLKEIRYWDGKSVKYEYNPLGQLIQAEDWLGGTSIERNLAGQVISTTDYKGRKVSYEYGTGNEVTSITYPDGKKVHYQYDEMLRLVLLSDGDIRIRYDYGLDGRLNRKTLPDGMFTDYIYNEAGQLKTLTHYKDKKNVMDRFKYDYDLNGNIVRLIKHQDGLKEESGLYQYEYDCLDRLTRVSCYGETIRSFTYDAYGNRISRKDNNGITIYEYNELNQLIVESGKVIKDYRYDKRGNLTQVLKNGIAEQEYSYGPINEMISAGLRKGIHAVYRYNGFGKRIAMQEYEGEGLVKDIDYILDITKEYHNLLQLEENGVTQHYIWDLDAAYVKQSTKYGFDGPEEEEIGFYFQDEHGSTVRIVDNKGKTKEVNGYDEFGNSILKKEKRYQAFSYAGYQMDKISGNYFVEARYYNPDTAQMLSQDPVCFQMHKMPNERWVTDSQTHNLYNYCGNNPVIYVDSSGCAKLSYFGDTYWYTADDKVLNWFTGIYGNIPYIGLAVPISEGIVDMIFPGDIDLNKPDVIDNILSSGATTGTYIGLISDAVNLLGKEALDKFTKIGSKISWIGTGLGVLGFAYSEYKTDYETQKAVELTHTVNWGPSKEQAVFMAIYAETAMKDMLDTGRVKLSKDGKELIWYDKEAEREFYDAIFEIKGQGCSE